MKGMAGKFYCSLILGMLFIITNSLQAVPILSLGFEHLTSNSPTVGTPVGEAQITVDIYDLGGNRVKFLFINEGPAASSITDIYFDNGTLLGISSVDNLAQPKVKFDTPASPGNLPGSNFASPAFQRTAGFSADSDPPTAGPNGNGVNPGESVAIIFNLQSAGTVADVIDELIGSRTGELRIGIHVQSFSDGSSESFINVVPEPATLMLLSLGAVGLIRKRRKA